MCNESKCLIYLQASGCSQGGGGGGGGCGGPSKPGNPIRNKKYK